MKEHLTEIVREIIKERVDLEGLHDGISMSTITGNAWVKLINSLETVYDEVKDFNSLYSSHKPLPNTAHAKQSLEQVIKLLEQIKPVILGMDDIEKKDYLR